MNVNIVSKMELAKALKSIRDVAPDEETYQKIAAMLLPSDGNEADAVEKAIEGLSEEDEFALLCRLMGTCTHLVPLEGRPIIPSDDNRPDFLANFKPGLFFKGLN